MMKNLTWIVLLIMAAACGTTKTSTESYLEEEDVTIVPDEGMVMVWISTDPVQCLENPWEQWWMVQNPEQSYPKGQPRVLESEEQAIILTFFKKAGVIVSDITFIPYPENAVICDACTCPDGYTLYLQVPEDKVDFMSRQFRFELTEAPK